MSLLKYILTEQKNFTSIDHILNMSSWKPPKYLYHLTPHDYINDVKKNGLQIKYSKQHKFERGIYLTDDFSVAIQYQYLDEERDNFYIIEIPFNKLNPNYMKPDDYELFDIIEDEWQDILDFLGIYEVRGNEQLIWESLDYEHSIFICNQILYTQDIKSVDFSNVYDKKLSNQKLWDTK